MAENKIEAGEMLKIMLDKKTKQFIKRCFRHSLESLGCEKYAYPALNNLDKRIFKYLNKKEGIFIEAGANNGYSQSNTYYLERFMGWKGVLVEPIPELYDMCVKERKKSKVFNYCLVSNDYKDKYVEIYNASLMSVVKGVMAEDKEKKHLDEAKKCERDIDTKLLKIPARTLTSILKEANIGNSIDFLSLDVEGYELDVLKGLDFEEFAPEFILVEANKRKELDLFLLPKYSVIEEYSSNDVLYKKR